MNAKERSERLDEEPKEATVRFAVPASGFVVAAAATAGAAGAAAGSLGGPVGAAVGGIVGALAGGMTGSTIGRLFDPSKNEAYWRDRHATQPYAKPGDSFNEFLGAYQSGYETYFVAPDNPVFDDDVARERYVARGGRLEWSQARPAAVAAWQRAREPVVETSGNEAEAQAKNVSPET